MKFELLVLNLKIYLCKILKRDSMKYKLRKYELSGVKIGEGIRAFSPITSAEPYLISVGDNTTISSGVKFITHDNAVIKCTEGTDLVGSISIGKNCFIGMNSVLLPGVSIADNCIVGAGSIVTKSVTEESVVVAGNPARRICEVSEYAEKNNENIFNFKGVKRCEKKHLILNNPDKWVRR